MSRGLGQMAGGQRHRYLRHSAFHPAGQLFLVCVLTFVIPLWPSAPLSSRTPDRVRGMLDPGSTHKRNARRWIAGQARNDDLLMVLVSCTFFNNSFPAPRFTEPERMKMERERETRNILL